MTYNLYSGKTYRCAYITQSRAPNADKGIDLVNNTSYTFYVYAINQRGPGEPYVFTAIPTSTTPPSSEALVTSGVLGDFETVTSLTSIEFSSPVISDQWYFEKNTGVVVVPTTQPQLTDAHPMPAVSGFYGLVLTTTSSRPISYVHTTLNNLDVSTSYTLTFSIAQRWNYPSPEWIVVTAYDGVTQAKLLFSGRATSVYFSPHHLV